MIKLLCLDLDGVLCSSKDFHYYSLNEALKEIDEKYLISREEHLAMFDGLPTSKKLNILSEKRGLPKEYHSKIWQLKQEKTKTVILENVNTNIQLQELFKFLSNSLRFVCVSNSIRSNTILILAQLGILQYFDHIVSNEDVYLPKPNAEPYLRAMILCKVNPQEVLVVEDSHIGRESATRSGAHLLGIKSPEELTLELIKNKIKEIEMIDKKIKPKWQGGKMNVLIPSAGRGHRFEVKNYQFPKPLIETIDKKPMIQLVVENLNIDAQHIFIVQKEHCEKYHLDSMLNIISPKCKIVEVNEITEGAACTTLLAKDLINNNEPLLIANCDQYIEDFDSNTFLYSMMDEGIDGGILTFTAVHSKWSFVKLDENGFINEVAEKNPISNIANTGIMYWKRGSDYVKYAEQMIAKNIRINNEFYVAPVYNQAIQDGKKFKIFPIKEMFGVGTPEDLEAFLNHKRLTNN